MKKPLFVVMVVCAMINSEAQTPTWGSFLINQHIASFAVDDAGQFYCIRTLSPFSDMDPGPSELIYHHEDYNDVYFLTAYNADGALIWFRNITGIDFSHGHEVMLLNNGHLLVTGTYRGGSNPSLDANFPDLVTAPLGGVFVAEYDVSGNLLDQFSIRIGNATTLCVAETNDDKLIMGITSDQSIYDASLNPIALQNDAGIPEVYILQISDFTSIDWVRQLEGDQAVQVTDIAVDELNRIVVCGRKTGNLQWNGNILLNDLNTDPLQSEGWIARLNAQGNSEWFNYIDQSGITIPTQVSTTYANEILLGCVSNGTFISSNAAFEHTENLGKPQCIQVLNETGQCANVLAFAPTYDYLTPTMAFQTSNQNQLLITGGKLDPSSHYLEALPDCDVYVDAYNTNWYTEVRTIDGALLMAFEYPIAGNDYGVAISGTPDGGGMMIGKSPGTFDGDPGVNTFIIEGQTDQFKQHFGVKFTLAPTEVSDGMADHSAVWPNPGNGVFQTSRLHGACLIYTSQGQLVKTIQLLEHQTTVDISDLSNGLYYLRNGLQTFPLLKQ